MRKYFVIRSFRGTCSSVGMLKGYMVRKRLGTPVLEFGRGSYNQAVAAGLTRPLHTPGLRHGNL